MENIFAQILSELKKKKYDVEWEADGDGSYLEVEDRMAVEFICAGDDAQESASFPVARIAVAGYTFYGSTDDGDHWELSAEERLEKAEKDLVADASPRLQDVIEWIDEHVSYSCSTDLSSSFGLCYPDVESVEEDLPEDWIYCDAGEVIYPVDSEAYFNDDLEDRFESENPDGLSKEAFIRAAAEEEYGKVISREEAAERIADGAYESNC